MKVLQIVSGYQKQELYAELFSHLKELGVDNYVYSQINRGENIPEQLLCSRDVVFSKGYNKLERFSFFIKQNDMFASIQKTFSIDDIKLTHAHTLFSSGYTAYRLKKKYGVPYVITVRGADVNFFFKYYFFLRPLGMKILREASSVVFLSESFRERMFDKYVPQKYRNGLKVKNKVIPNGIAEIFFKNLGVRKELTDVSNLKLIMVANINANKNLDGLVKVCRTLIKDGYNIHLTVVGAIRESGYEKFIEENADIIEYHNKSPQEQVIGYLRASDIFVMPSHSETFGLVYAEAMSQGLPIIYTRGQGFDRQFEEGVVGYAVNDRDSNDIANAIKRIAHNYSELSANCIKLVNKYKWSDIAYNHLVIYNSAVALDNERQ